MVRISFSLCEIFSAGIFRIQCIQRKTRLLVLNACPATVMKPLVLRACPATVMKPLVQRRK